ncbi:MAG: hypothetical protein J1F32_01750 [Erysipelotrichales bacterium]|nr:hypothetical protein [Erysipelotrichales bacterium]
MAAQTLYRCFNDGSHNVAIRYYKKDLEVVKEKESIRNYESEFVRTYGKCNVKRGGAKIVNEEDNILDEIYLLSIEKDVSDKDRLRFMLSELKNYDSDISEKVVINFLKTKAKLLKSRLDRFRKKALNNIWNYFVTFTYDDNKHDEISFVDKLKKCFSNLHSRYGYRCMGVFERSLKGRLHFHGLMYVPNGEMRGEIINKIDYSTSDKKMRITHINTFFEKRFGRNDFVEIDCKNLKHDGTINYLLKYISKSNEKIFYSRGIPTFLYIKFDEEDSKYILCEFGEFVKKYVLFDDVDIIDSDMLVKMSC